MRRAATVLAPLALLCALLVGCDDGSSDGAAPPTSRTGGSEVHHLDRSRPTAAGSSAPGRRARRSLWGLVSEPCPRPGADPARCAVGPPQRRRRLDVDAPEQARRRHRRSRPTADSGQRGPFRRHHPRLGRTTAASSPPSTAASGGSGSTSANRSWPSSRGHVGLRPRRRLPRGRRRLPGPMRLFEGTIATGRWRFVTLGSTCRRPTPAARGEPLRRLRPGGRREPGPDVHGPHRRRAVGTPPAPLPPGPGGGHRSGAGTRGRLPADRHRSAPVELQTSSDGGKTWAVVWQHTFPSPVTSLAVTGQAVVVPSRTATSSVHRQRDGLLDRPPGRGRPRRPLHRRPARHPAGRPTERPPPVPHHRRRRHLANRRPPPLRWSDAGIQTGPGHEQECVLAP